MSQIFGNTVISNEIMEKPAGRREAGALILPVSYALTLDIATITFDDFLKAGLYNNGRGYVIMGKIFAYYTQISNLITLISSFVFLFTVSYITYRDCRRK